MFASLAHIRTSHHNCFFPCLYVRITGAHQGLSSYLFLSLSLCSHHWRTSGPLIMFVSFFVSMFTSLAHIRASHHICFFLCLYVRITGAHQGLSSYLFLSLSLCSHHWCTSGPLIIIVSFLVSCSHHWCTSGPLIIFVSFFVSMFASLAHIRASHHVSFLVSMFASLAHIRASHHNLVPQDHIKSYTPISLA